MVGTKEELFKQIMQNPPKDTAVSPSYFWDKVAHDRAGGSQSEFIKIAFTTVCYEEYAQSLQRAADQAKRAEEVIKFGDEKQAIRELLRIPKMLNEAHDYRQLALAASGYKRKKAAKPLPSQPVS